MIYGAAGVERAPARTGAEPRPRGADPGHGTRSAFAIPEAAGRREVDRAAQGRLGHRGETVTWFGAAWLPVWSLQLGLSRRQGLVHRVDAVTDVWNDYEALTATLLEGSTTDPALVPVDVAEGAIRPRLDQKTMGAKIADAERRWQRARDVGVHGSDAKFQRQLDARDAAKKALADLGVEAPVEHISIDHTALTYHPLLARSPRPSSGTSAVHRRHRRSGRPLATLNDMLTAQSRWVRESLAGLSLPPAAREVETRMVEGHLIDDAPTVLPGQAHDRGGRETDLQLAHALPVKIVAARQEWTCRRRQRGRRGSASATPAHPGR